MDDAADHPAIVGPLDPSDIRRQVRLNPLPLLFVQPKQLPAHIPIPLPNSNQDRIFRPQELMSSDPRVYGNQLLLVRPDQHIAWRGLACDSPRDADAIITRVLGWENSSQASISNVC
jgi:hypothetical protein